jgi:hypothetical protein
MHVMLLSEKKKKRKKERKKEREKRLFMLRKTSTYHACI